MSCFSSVLFYPQIKEVLLIAVIYEQGMLTSPLVLIYIIRRDIQQVTFTLPAILD